MGFILLKIQPEALAQIRQLSTTSGFCEAFEQNLTTSKTFREAWEITETAHEEVFGRRRYTEYSNFCTARSKELKRKH